jgi:signal peptidase I
MLELLIFLPLSFTLPTIFAWGVFEKAGRKAWETLIPFYNLYVFIKIIQKPLWWFLLLFFPFINVFVYMLMLVELAKGFEKYKLHQQFIAVVLPFVYFPYLGFSKTENFVTEEKRQKFEKGFTREWVDAIIFAVVAATIIRTFLLEAYTIPTSSMEKSLLVGDYLFVSKIAYGPKAPNTPISFPFVHHTLPFSETTPSFVEWIKLPYFRFPGFGSVQRYDAVVFNYPDGDTVSTRYQSNKSYYVLKKEYGRKRIWTDKRNFGDIVYRPVDKRENYIKRCIGLPGDSLKVVDRQVYINGEKSFNPAGMQFQYWVKTDGSSINPRILDDLNVTEFSRSGQPGLFMFVLTDEAKTRLEKLPIVESITPFNDPAGEWNKAVFPQDERYQWNRDNYGPIYIPKKGVAIALNLDVLPLYERLITVYEGNTLEVKSNQIFINGELATSFTPKLDYYWMMGDNRHNSADSRYWGFVPEDHIVGKAEFVWLSLDPNKSLFTGKIRWNKVFRMVK